jgi:hypothetical protein
LPNKNSVTSPLATDLIARLFLARHYGFQVVIAWRIGTDYQAGKGVPGAHLGAVTLICASLQICECHFDFILICELTEFTKFRLDNSVVGLKKLIITRKLRTTQNRQKVVEIISPSSPAAFTRQSPTPAGNSVTH